MAKEEVKSSQQALLRSKQIETLKSLSVSECSSLSYGTSLQPQHLWREVLKWFVVVQPVLPPPTDRGQLRTAWEAQLLYLQQPSHPPSPANSRRSLLPGSPAPLEGEPMGLQSLCLSPALGSHLQREFSLHTSVNNYSKATEAVTL